jgi:hypothetical protein
MPQQHWNDRQLSALHQPPRRNRYFYGKLMDVLQFSMEQEYLIAEQRRLNRTMFGAGVVCGLAVEVIRSGKEQGVRVSPGLAIDGWGRRILVPDEVDLLPLSLTDEDGNPLLAEALPPHLILTLCYRECQTGFEPALVPDPHCGLPQRSEAGSWIETYALHVHEGTAPDIVRGCRPEVRELLQQGEFQRALCLLATECTDPPDDPCITLANLTVDDRGTLTASPCLPRPVVPTNQTLLQLIVCLAERVEECCCHCDDDGDTKTYLSVGRATLIRGNGPDITVSTPRERPRVDQGTEPRAVEFEFAGALADQASAVLDSTVVLRHDGNPVPDLQLTWRSPTQLRLATRRTFPPGTYTVTLRGDPPALTSVATNDSPAHALDGDPADFWPTGDHHPGGNFVLTFDVT